jgi:hypothetical protein
MPDDHSKLDPLLPIPNRTVKRLSADDSAGSRVKVGHCQALMPQNAHSVEWAFCFVERLCRSLLRCELELGPVRWLYQIREVFVEEAL